VKAVPTPLPDVFVVEPELISDERGFFARTWCHREFEQLGLGAQIVQCNVSFNHVTGTLRGMHYQAAPYEEAKLVRCTRGRMYDVALDLRPESTTYCRWFGIVLDAENRKALYVPPGCAHGFLTLADDTEVFYQMSEYYEPGAGRGVRYNDPVFGIDWPGAIHVINERDRTYADFLSER